MSVEVTGIACEVAICGIQEVYVKAAEFVDIVQLVARRLLAGRLVELVLLRSLMKRVCIVDKRMEFVEVQTGDAVVEEASVIAEAFRV